MVANLFGPDLGIVVVVIVVVLLAGSQLPKIARNVGSAGREFRKAQQEADEELSREKEAQAAQAARSAADAPAAAIPPPVPASPAPPAAPATPAAPAASVGSDSSISLTPAQLDALLKAREEQVRRETSTEKTATDN